MNQIEFDVAAWKAFIATHPESNFLQSVEWGEAHEAMGMKVIRRGLMRDGLVVAGWQGIVKDAKRGRYLEVPGGPLLDWNDVECARVVTQQLRESGQHARCVFVRIRPQLHDESYSFRSLGYRPAPMHLHAEHTTILDLQKSEEELLTGMRRQTRYEVRRADKQGIEVSWANDREAIETFFDVQAETAARQGFVPPTKRFLLAQQHAFGDRLRIYRATKDGVLLNMALILYTETEADYFEAASTAESRHFAGAYALQWQIIRDMKAMHIARYNFWGIARSHDPGHRFAGVTTFKRGFGGDDVTYVPAQDLVLRPYYALNFAVETIRRKKRKL